MKKINNKSINYGFKILTILAFGLLIIPAQASADRAGYITPYNSTNFNNRNNQNYYQPYQPLIYTAPAPVATPTVYSYSANPNRTTNVSTVSRTTNTSSQNTPATNTDSDSASALAAGAIYGSDSFLPSGLLQWIMLAIVILLVIIVARRVFGAKENYDAIPMKHA